MPTPFEQQRTQMASRMAPSGGMGVGGQTPPPGSNPQQPPGGASSRLEPLLQQVMQILVEGNPADLEAFGKFMTELQTLVQDHQGQGMQQGQPPMAGGMSQGIPPQVGR